MARPMRPAPTMPTISFLVLDLLFAFAAMWALPVWGLHSIAGVFLSNGALGGPSCFDKFSMRDIVELRTGAIMGTKTPNYRRRMWSDGRVTIPAAIRKRL